MKKILFLVTALTITAASVTSIHAQEAATSDKKIGVYIEPLAMALGRYGGHVQIGIGDKSHLAVFGSVFNVPVAGYENFTGWTGGLGYRFMFGNGGPLKGLYAGPAFHYWNIDFESYAFTALLFGGEVGYQWLLDMGLSFGARVGYLAGSISTSSGSSSVSIPLGGITYNLDVGWAF